MTVPNHISVSSPPLVSVIVPCFKQACFLPDALNSVLAQTYPHWECIVINDGSPDSTSEVAGRFISANSSRKILLHEKENEGLAEARNSGIRLACGEWIAGLDSDDMFAPNYLEAAINKAQTRPGVNHVAPDIQYFGAKEGTNPVHPFRLELLLEGNMFPYASMYRRELWERAGGYLPIIPFGAEDWNFWVTCSAHLVHERLGEPLFRYRKHDGPSMVDAVERYQAQVDACLRTIHPGLYPVERLLHEHEVLASMAAETRAKVDSTIARFPYFSQPYLWRGLHNHHTGSKAQARRDYTAAARLSGGDWQPAFWLAVVCAEEGDSIRAAQAAQETLNRCPGFPLRAQMERLINSCSQR